jgi:cyclopropane-fatty-acyl-phospholipid synthase
LQDYRETQGRFDRIVSVGMFEHVGVGYFDDYFRKIAELLAEDGVALVHTITRTDGPGVTNPWITKHIFPGGYIPAISEALPAIERAGLIVTDVEILQLHYAQTLKAWRERFMARRAEAATLYDERFCRMWEFYLAGSEACFRLGQHVNCQFQLAKKVGVVPMTRSYMAAREQSLRLRDGASQDLRMAGE